MKRIIGTVAAVAAAVVFMPLSPAYAEDPFSCNGSPELPDTYFCVVRFQAGAEPTVQQVPVGVPSETVEVQEETVEAGGDEVVLVPSLSVTVPAQGVHLPVVCAGVTGFCVGPFDPSTPAITLTTPEVTQDLPLISQTIPGFTQSTPPVSGQVPVLGAEVPPGAILVVWYKGACTYLYPDGTRAKAKAALPSNCP